MANGAPGVNVIKLSLPPHSQQDKLAPDMFFSGYHITSCDKDPSIIVITFWLPYCKSLRLGSDHSHQY